MSITRGKYVITWIEYNVAFAQWIRIAYEFGIDSIK